MKNLNRETLMKSAAKQKPDSIVEMELDGTTQTWIKYSKKEFYYNAEMQNTSYLEKEWDNEPKTYKVGYKTELGYDKQGRVNTLQMYTRIETGQAPFLTSKYVNFYNSQGILDSTLSYSTENAGVNWVLDLKQINYYNASKQLIKVDIWALDEDLGVLLLSMKTVYTYSAIGKIKTSSTNYLIDGVEMLYSKTEYNYDANGKIISTEDWDLSFQTSFWKRVTVLYISTMLHVMFQLKFIQHGTALNGRLWRKAKTYTVQPIFQMLSFLNNFFYLV